MKKRFQLSNVLFFSFAHFMHDIYTSFLSPLLPLLIEKLSISYSLAGLLSVGGRLPSLLNPFIGLLADRLGFNFFLISAPTITAIAMSLLGVAPNYATLLFLLILMGIGSSFFHVPGPVVMRHYSGERTGTGMSFYMTGGEAARTLSPLIILFVVSNFGLGKTWILIPLGLITSIFLFFKLRKESVSATFSKKKRPQNNVKGIMKKFLPFFIALGFFSLFRGLLKGAVTTFLPTYLTSSGTDLVSAGISLAVIQGAGAAGTFLWGILSDRIGKVKTLYIVALATPLLMWLFLSLDGFLATMTLIPLGFVLFATGPVILAIVQEEGKESPAFVNSIYMTLSFFLQSLAVLGLGVLGDIFTLEKTYWVISITPFLSIPAIMKINSFTKRREITQ